MRYRKILSTFGIGLLLMIASFFGSALQPSSADNLASTIQQNLLHHIQQIEEQGNAILRHGGDAWQNASYSFFLMDSVRITSWNSNTFVPDIRTVQDDFELRLLQWPRGTFLLRKWKTRGATFLLGVLPLQDRYKINNRYLISGFNKQIFPVQSIAITDRVDEGYPFLWNGKYLFSLEILSLPDSGAPTIAIVLFIFGLVLCIGGIVFLVLHLHEGKEYGFALLSLFASFVGGRILLLLFADSPNGPLFDPVNFASSAFNRSIGDLFFNAVVVLVPITYLFYNYQKFGFTTTILKIESRVLRSIVTIVVLGVGILSFLYPFLFFETLFHNSSISLDITQSIAFDWLRIVAYLSVIIGCISGFMMSHLLLRLGSKMAGGTLAFIANLLISVTLFFLVSLFSGKDYSISITVGALFFLCVYFLRLNRTLYRTSYATFLYVFVAIIAFSAQGALSIKRFMIEDKVNSQFRFASTFLAERDFLGEFLLNESVQRISSDPFVQTRLGSPFLGKAAVRQKVKQIYLNSYFDRYDIKIYLFNSAGVSFDNTTSQTFAQLITHFQNEASRTNFEGIYYLRDITPETTKRYLAVVPVNRFGSVIGYVVLDLSQKRVIPRNVFPELLLDDRFVQYFKNRDFSYAVFSDGEVTSSFGSFGFEREFTKQDLANPLLFSEGLVKQGHIHVGVSDDSDKITVVSSPNYPWLRTITNFSFLFVIGLLLVLSTLLVFGLISLYSKRPLNYSARIQLYVYLAFVLPLVLVSLTTLGLIGRSAESQLNEEYLERSMVLGERLSPLLDTLQTEGGVAADELDSRVIDLARLANVDASVFNTDGKLMASSQPLIYEDRILSTLISRTAFERIVEEKEQSFIANEKVGSLKYNSSYSALKSPDSGELIGILSIPFFESATSLERTQINAMANIINIFTIVFILFSMLSFFAVRWLTFPLQFITRTLQRTTLTGENKPLTWSSDDEIGLMVNEYNKMVENLEKSKIELSRVQKESAWREIAKQVAHEVKNPLTPMKLTLQQMEYAVAKDGLSKEKIKSSLEMLLRQVEILNEIAASFSAFARMPAPILERIDITKTLTHSVDLHRGQGGKISLDLAGREIFVMGDEQLLIRIFSNIILNALQAGDEQSNIVLEISVRTLNGNCLIEFKDNGSGIDRELADKVFLPNFSTKKSGSGIGLAIAKQGIEQSGGKIWFETEIGNGTCFFIEIPLAS
ncbi:MAG: ATP-binding protein [Cyclobacteriaceae bacterium]